MFSFLISIVDIDCGIISVINGTFSAPQGTTAPNTATIRCNEGYIIDGKTSKEINCTISGNWSSTDYCTGKGNLTINIL